VSKCAKLLFATLFLLFLADSSLAQGSFFTGSAWRYTPAGVFAASGATVTVCTSNGAGAPCTPTISLFKDSALLNAVANPLPVCGTPLPQFGCIDGLGNFSFYASTPGPYTYTITGAGLTAYGPIPIYSSLSPAANLNLTGAVAVPPPGSLNVTGTDTSTNFDKTILMEGTTYPFNGTGLQAAITAGGAGARIVTPPNTTITVDTTTPIVISNSGVTLEGGGYGSIISYTGTGHLFNVNGSSFKLKNLTLNGASVGSRAAVCTFNVQAGGGGLVLRDLNLSGAATINNGTMICETTLGPGTFHYDNIQVSGTSTWTAILKSQGSGSSTIPNTSVAYLIVGSGITCTDACLIADTATDTWQISDSVIVPTSGNPVHIRNTGAALAPRWIHFVNTFLECGGASSAFTDMKVDDGRDIQFNDGYMASCATGATLNLGQTKLDGNVFANIGQSAVVLAAGANLTKITKNTFDNTAVNATNTFDTISVAANTSDLSIEGNDWRQTVANVPRYGINIAAGTTNGLRIINNDTSPVAFGTASVLNGATGTNQEISGNAGFADVHKNGVASPQFANGLQVGSTIQSIGATATMGLTLKTGSGAGNYTGANTAAFASVDTTNLCTVITVPTGWKLLITANGLLESVTAAVQQSVALVDAGTTCAGGGVAPLNGTRRDITPPAIATFDVAFTIQYIFSGDGAAHSFSLAALTSNAADAWGIQNTSATAAPGMTFTLMPSN
jgi:hypothetical protein